MIAPEVLLLATPLVIGALAGYFLARARAVVWFWSLFGAIALVVVALILVARQAQGWDGMGYIIFAALGGIGGAGLLLGGLLARAVRWAQGRGRPQ